MHEPTAERNFNQCVHFLIRTAAHHEKSWPAKLQLKLDLALKLLGTGRIFASADSALRNELLAKGVDSWLC